MANRGVMIAAAVVVVLAIVIGAVLLLRRVGPPGRDQPERQASEDSRGAPRSAPPSPVPQIGTGTVAVGDWWELRFTAPKYPDDPANHRGGLDERLVALIDTATTSLDVAIYDFDLLNVADAMARAAGRKVKVRMVTDTDTLTNARDEHIQAAFARLKQAGIPIVDDRREDIMHHKFTVVDGEWVQTGSWNYTDGDTYRLNNHQIIVRSRELAANFTTEFEKMFVQRTFGAAKPRGTPNSRLSIAGVRVESYFAPKDEVAEQIVGTIGRQAPRELFFMAFSFTHDGIGQAMLDRARAGATVRGVFETTGSNTTYSEYNRLKGAGLEVYQDGNPWVMHHKAIVLDERVSIFGSFNFSSNADTGNDENLIIIDEPRIAQAFRAEFERILALAKDPPARKR